MASVRLRKLDRNTAQRIVDYMEQRIAPLGNPRSKARKMEGGRFSGYWRYRVGDHRVICDIQDILGVLYVSWYSEGCDSCREPCFLSVFVIFRSPANGVKAH